jgi:hypothetical protein
VSEFFQNPAWPWVVVTLLISTGICWGLVWNLGDRAKTQANAEREYQVAEANAKPMSGTISRFGTESADDYSTRYVFAIDGDLTVYSTSSRYLSRASHGALTKPGDMAMFRVLPGFADVRDFYNASTSKS